MSAPRTVKGYENEKADWDIIALARTLTLRAEQPAQTVVIHARPLRSALRIANRVAPRRHPT